jgi:hypothetical protein
MLKFDQDERFSTGLTGLTGTRRQADRLGF